ncbi:MAG: FHA domain-containing protein, partial [Deltaproteobacteria bacterium]
MLEEPQTTLSVLTESPVDGARLLVIDGASSLIVGLPAAGTVTIGRAPECEVRLGDAACSRRHARLHVDDGTLMLEDLGSHNGTRVNGERVTGRHPLTSDDVISIGPIRLVIYAQHRARRAVLLEPAALRGRLVQEVERAVSYERPLCVAVVATDRNARSIASAVTDSLRLVDVIGVLDERHLVVLMPELGPAAARTAAERFLSAIDRNGVSVGLAACPADACASEALIAAARAAAARGGGVRDAAECFEQLQLAGSTALVVDAAMIQIYDLVRRLAASDLSVLISGETGVGKENVAHALHQWSPRASRPFVAINCASLPEALVESELFGHERGAFTNAVSTKVGHLEAADGGTVFFDEIGELPLAAQAKLLRALESRRILRIGGRKELAVDVRVVAATNRKLEVEVKEGRFREDLFFRLGAAKVVIPPLRERPRELALLARYFVERACTAADRAVPELSPATLVALAHHRWSGNVRELKNEMEYVAATATDLVVEPWHLSERIAATAPCVTVVPRTQRPMEGELRFRPINDELRDLERRRMREALAAAGGVQKKAAELIGMPLRTFTMKYKQ